MDDEVQRLIDQTQIHTAVQELGRQVAAEYEHCPLTILGVLTGSIVFLADLIRSIDLPLRVGLIQASSYRGAATTPGELRVGEIQLPEIAGRHVLLVDDIFDTGHTLAALLQLTRERSPASIKSAVLLWKEGRQQVETVPDYHCFRIPDVFVVGYGLDYNDEHRHLPYIAALELEDLA